MLKKDKFLWNAHFNKLSKKISSIFGKRIQVKMISGDDLGYTSNNGKICINPTHELVPKETAQAVMFVDGVACHELGHQLFTNFTMMTDFLNSDKFDDAPEGFKDIYKNVFHQIINIVEDTSIEFWLHQTIGGSLIKSLDYTIARIFRNSPKLEEANSPFGQVVSALIMYGDVGMIKGKFTFPESRKAFLNVQPIYDKAIEESSFAKRLKISYEIFELLKPLWLKEAEKEKEFMDMLNDLMEAMGASEKSDESENSGKYSEDAGEAGSGEVEPSKRSSRAKKTVMILEKKDSEETNGETEDGDTNSVVKENDSSDDENSETNNEKSNGDKSDSSDPKESGKDDCETGENDETKDGNASDNSEPGDGASEENTDESDSKEDGKSGDSDEDTGNENCATSNLERHALKDVGMDEFDYESELEDIYEDCEISDEEVKRIENELSEEIVDELSEESKESSEALPDFDISGKGYTKASCKNENVAINPENYELLSERYLEIVHTFNGDINRLTGRLKRIIKSEQEEKEARTTGRFNIPRYASGKRTARMFDKRVIPSKSDMAAFILIDESGSMWSRYKYAQNAAIAITEVCGKCDIPLYVMGFSADEKGYQANHFHYVKWKNTPMERLALLNIRARANNFDGYSIRYATKILGQRPESKKLMIVISDGEPACRSYRDYSSGGIADTKEAVRMANKNCVVQGIAVGGCDTDILHEIYGINFLNNNNISELFTDLGKVLAKRLRD